MSETSGNISTPEKSPKKSKTLLFVVIGLAVLLIAALVYNFMREQKLKETQAELMKTYSQLDSIGNEMQKKIVEIEQLGGNVEELTMVRDSLMREKESLLKQRTNTYKQIKALKSRVAGYKELLVMKDKEIEELKKVNQELLVENTELKEERNVLNQNLRQAKQVEEELTQKVQVASRLVAENIVVAAVNRRGKEREGEFRSRHIDKLKVQFNIAKNDVAPVEGKEILLRIIDDNGSVLFDVAKGSGTFILDGKETFYTLKQEILFDNTGQVVSFLYDKGSEYLPGRYVAEIYTDGYLMGRKSFKVK